MNVEEFIRNASSHKEISYLWSSSIHKDFARKTLNEIIKGHPQYAEAIFVLSKLPLLLWAEEKREGFLDNYCVGYSKAFAASEKEYCKLGDLAAKTIAMQISEEVLKSVHLNSNDISLFIIKKYYKDEVMHLCEKTWRDINAICEELLAKYNALRPEETVAFHDIEFLSALNRDYLMGHETAGNMDSHTMLLDAVECAESYPKSLSQCECLSRFIEGQTESHIAREIGKSRTYVRGRLCEGKMILSTLFWGLSDKESLIWIGENHRWNN